MNDFDSQRGYRLPAGRLCASAKPVVSSREDLLTGFDRFVLERLARS
jgi:hypothetical protein